MRTILFAAVALAAVCLQNVAAIPHGAHRNLHIKKDYTTAVVTEYTTIVVPEFIVWVDDEGKVVSTETKSGGFSTPTTSPPSTTVAPATTSSPTVVVQPSTPSAVAVSSAPPPPIPTTSSTTPPPPAAETTPAQPPPAAETSAAASSAYAPPRAAPTSSGDTPSPITTLGISYDVLKGPFPPTCATDAQVAADMAKFAGLGYGMVRIYDITCNQVALVTKYAAQYNMKVFVTIPTLDNLAADIPNAIHQAAGNLDTIDTVAIGNELVQDGTPAAAVVAALGQARPILANLGYTASIVTVDTFGMLLTNPSLCGASDYCAANCHAFFTDTVTSAEAGAYVKSMMQAVSTANNGKLTRITESGWPWAGLPNGVANPSVPDQKAALASIRGEFPNGGVTLFEAYDAAYKPLGEFNVEPFWGMYGPS